MILGQVSWLDIIVFLIFLAPQLIWQVGFFRTLFCGLRALPFLLIKLPYGFIYDHFFTKKQDQTKFIQKASWFEDVVIRCVRYAFGNIPAYIGRVFFSKGVALPFLRFRMLRHGYIRSPIHWSEINRDDFKGVWAIADPTEEPDVIIYYAHGGGFSMGSSYFYLEFLLAWLSLLTTQGGFRNPAILALEYTLVPDASYPTQIHQTLAGYRYLLSLTHIDSSKICVSGDSAGGTLVLSLLLHLAEDESTKSALQPLTNGATPAKTRMPALALLISPWTTLYSPLHKTNTSDYLSAPVLLEYALQYACPPKTKPHNSDKLENYDGINDPLTSPGLAINKQWLAALPQKGIFITYGDSEVFAPSIIRLVSQLRKGGIEIDTEREDGGIHAWPVVSMFLAENREKRLKGLRVLVDVVKTRMGTQGKEF